MTTRTTQRGYRTLVGLGAAASAALAGCTAGGDTGGARDASTSGSGSRLVVAYNNTVSSIDPLEADFSQTNMIDRALYDTLITYNQDGDVVGQLATKFTMKDRARAIDITLRKDAVFHDGTPVTAKDVAFTLDRYSGLGKGVAGYISDYASTTVHDKYSLTIKLDKPNSLFLGSLSNIFILNSKLVKKHAGSDHGQSWLSNHDAGSGPYSIDNWSGSASITASRFDGYWAFDKKRPKTLVLRLIKESATMRDELRAGTVDVVSGISPSDAKSLKGQSGINISFPASKNQIDVYFNITKGPTANIAVRKAIRLAFDYRGGLNKLRDGQGKLANGPLPRTLPCRPDLPTAHQDLAKARQILKNAGLHDLSLTLTFQPAFTIQKREATLLQSNLRKIGIDLKLKPIQFPDYLSSLNKTDTIPQMMLLEEFAQIPDPGSMLTKFYASSSIGTTNRSGYSNPNVDALLDKALSSTDSDQRCTYYTKAQKEIYDDAVQVSFYTLHRPLASTTRAQNVVWSPLGSGVWIPALQVK